MMRADLVRRLKRKRLKVRDTFPSCLLSSLHIPTYRVTTVESQQGATGRGRKPASFDIQDGQHRFGLSLVPADLMAFCRLRNRL